LTHQIGKFQSIIVCRPALPMDTEEAFALSQLIWEGDDYVPQVWEEWLSDPEGLFAVAEYRGHVVGFGKLTKLSPDEWWLEGLRVHPDFEGLGIASRVNNYQYEFWLQNGSGVLRLATSSTKEPVKHIAHKFGFQNVGEYTTFEAPVSTAQEHPSRKTLFTPVNLTEKNNALDLILDTAMNWSPYKLLDIGWKWVSPQVRYLEDYIRKNQAWWWRDKQGMLIQVDKREGDELWARIRFLVCSPELLNECLFDARTFAHRCGFERVTWLAPLTPDSQNTLEKSGFKRSWDGSLLIYEKDHPLMIRKT
jgi:GNAT superfamily N-acetyltransferase